jgi:hypothetical protein
MNLLNLKYNIIKKLAKNEFIRSAAAVEHSIGGMKRFRILEHRNRLKKQGILNQVVGVCAALWNYTIEN